MEIISEMSSLSFGILILILLCLGTYALLGWIEIEAYDDEIDDFSDFQPRSYPDKIPDSHLKSPIRSSSREFFKGPVERAPNYLRVLIESSPVQPSQCSLDSEVLYGQLLGDVVRVQDSRQRSKLVAEHYAESISVARCLAQEVLHNCAGLDIPNHENVDEEEVGLQSLKHFWEDVRNDMREAKTRRNPPANKIWERKSYPIPSLPECFISSDYLLARSIAEGKWFVFDYDQIMMLADTISSRVNTICYNKALLDNIPGKLPTALILSIYYIFDSLFESMGNRAYELISQWESCCMAAILLGYDRLPYSRRYVDWFRAELEANGNPALNNLWELLTTSSLRVDQLSELHGLYRHWGHPTVNEELGCLKASRIAKNRPVPNGKVVQEVVGALKRQFVLSFLNKHGRWPKIQNLDELKNLPLGKLARMQGKAFNLHSASYPLKDWAKIRFGQEFEFDYHVDFTDCLEDTACGVYRSDIRSMYSSSSLGYRPKKAKTLRRVLLEILYRKCISIKLICWIVRLWLMPLDWLIIFVHSKEREMKTAPRLFAMMVLEMRLYFVVTEKNISSTIFKYFPQQTMTLSESDLVKRLLNLTGEFKSAVKYLAPVTGLDFKSWNLCWTHLSTYLVAEMLDDLFGVPGLYLNGHLFFERSLIALASHHNPPATLIGEPKGDPKECPTLWYEHYGGFEGIRQKLWTLLTIGILLLVEQDTGIKSYIVGQGDNQIVKMILPMPSQYSSPDEYLSNEADAIDKKIESFMSRVSEIAESLGHKVKREETWVATDLIVYGKDMLYQGSYLPQGLKRISRLFPDVNEVYPNLHTKIASLQTAGLSASQRSFCFITAYIYSTAEVIMVFYREIRRLKACSSRIMDQGAKITDRLVEMSATRNFKEFLIRIGSDIGGLPVLPLLSFFYRGHPDPLTAYLTTLYYSAQSNKVALRIYRWIEEGRYKINKSNPELLISNPNSLNIEVAEFLSTEYKRLIENSLIKRTKNDLLKQIFTNSAKTEDASLFKYLITLRPFHPRVAHEIFRQTVTGARLSFISKFSNTRTTQQLIGGAELGTSIVNRITDSEIRAVIFICGFYRELMDSNLLMIKSGLKCPTRLGQITRAICWSTTLDQEVPHGVTIPHPVHQFLPVYDLALNARYPYIYKSTSEPQIVFINGSFGKKGLLMSRGPYTAYIGSGTREKTTGKIFQMAATSRPLESAERMVQLYSWFGGSTGSFKTFVDRAIGARTNASFEQLTETTALITGGSVVHRLNDHCTKRSTMHSFRPNISTHIFFSTDRMGRLSRGADNYNLHFQGAVHYGFVLFEITECNFPELTPRTIHLTYRGGCCEELLEDFFMDSSAEPPKLVSMPNNPLVYAKIEDIPGSSRNQVRGNQIVTYVAEGSASEAIAHLLLSRIITTTNLNLVGFANLTNPLSGTISVADLLSVGITSVIDSLAKLLYLYLPKRLSSAWMIYMSIPTSCLSEMASLCLLPELYCELIGDNGGEGLPGAYFNLEICAMTLKLKIGMNLIDRYRNKDRRGSDYVMLTYYPSSQLGIYRILHMWARQLEEVSGGVIQISDVISNTHFRMSDRESCLMSFELSPIYNTMVKRYSPGMTHLILTTCPLRLSLSSAEARIRKERVILPPSAVDRSNLAPRQKNVELRVESAISPIHTTNYYLIMCALDRSGTSTLIPATITAAPFERKPRIREDHAYRTYGIASTSFFKFDEILLKESIPVKGSVVTLAEGEGSVARLLLDLGAKKVYYNSLIDLKNLIQHRSIEFVPACLSDRREQIEMVDHSVLTGGDLTEPAVLRGIVGILSQVVDCSLVTCDAEVVSGTNVVVAFKIVLAAMAVASAAKCPFLIVKMFLSSEEFGVKVIGLVQICYRVVRIIVPTFCSHENLEVYLVASQLDPLLDCLSLLKYHENPELIPSCTSAYNLGPSISTLLSKRRSTVPLQSLSPATAERLMIRARDRGIPLNLRHCLSRISRDFNPYQGGQIFQWCCETRSMVLNHIQQMSKMTAAPFYGDVLSASSLRVGTTNKALHVSIEEDLQSLICLEALERMLRAPNQEAARAVLLSSFSSGIKLETQTVEFYSYQPDPDELLSKFSKYLWRAWGSLTRSPLP